MLATIENILSVFTFFLQWSLKIEEILFLMWNQKTALFNEIAHNFVTIITWKMSQEIIYRDSDSIPVCCLEWCK